MNTKTILSLLLVSTTFLASCRLPTSIHVPGSTGMPSTEATSTTSFDEDVSPNNTNFDFTNETSRIERDVTYCTMDSVPLHADIYFPKNRSGTTPLLIYIHGGGWRSGNKSGGNGFLDFPALLDAGFTITSIDYRLAPEYQMPAMIEDVKCAVRFFRAHAADYNIDPNRIGAWGGSAGGHLVSMLGTSDESAGFDMGEHLEYSSRVQAVVDMFGPADFLTFPFSQHSSEVASIIFGTTDLSAPIFAAASPVTYISADDPPFLILQGDADLTVPLSQSQEFYDKLTESGVEAQLFIVTGGEHGLNSPNQTPPHTKLTQMIVEFFETNLK